MIRSFARFEDGTVRPDINLDEVVLFRSRPDVVTWTDISFGPGDEPAIEEVLGKRFQFHSMAIENSLRHSLHPRLDDWNDYVALVLHAVDFDAKATSLRLHELDVFVGRNFLVTLHEKKIAALDHTWDLVLNHPRRLVRGVDNLLFQLIDAVMSAYMPIIDHFDDWQATVEDEVFRRATPSTLAQIFRQKRVLIELRRVLSGQREVLNRLARDELAVIDAEDRGYFRDIYEHLVRLHDITESLRDLTGGILETYLSVGAQRTNEIMKTMTVFTVLFLPINFVASFFGMNFFGGPYEVEPPVSGKVILFAGSLTMVAVPVVMLLWMRRRGWIGR